MNFKRISYYLGFFCFPISILAFINILYSSYFDYFLSINSYVITLIVSFTIGSCLLFFGKRSEKRINFIEQLLLIILVYFLISFFVALPFYLSNYQVTLLNSLFEAISGITGTGFSIFKNIKYLFTPSCILFTIHNECLHTSKANILKKWASLNLYCSVHCKMNGYYHSSIH